MARLLLSLGCSLALICQLLAGVTAGAQPPAGVRLSLIQAAGSDVKYERIDVTNEGDAPVDVTGWRLQYKSASGVTTTPLLQFAATAGWRIMLDAGATESMVSKEFAGSMPADSPLRQALQFAAALNHTAGSVQLLDASGQVVDMVGWGTTAAESVRQGDAAAAMSATTWLRRQSATGNNAADFVLEQQTVNLPVRIGTLVETRDVCTNLDGIQQAAPDGYVAVNDGTCQPIDVCPNLPGVQNELPVGMEYDAGGGCVTSDVCQNLDGLQVEVPKGYELTGLRICEIQLPIRNIVISELLPNPSGADSGNEFIELYNADSEPVALDNYQLAIGSKTYALPAGVVIAPGAYWTVSDSELGASLANTTGSSVYLLTIRGAEVAVAPAYKNAGDDMAWALIDGTWQFTYAPTPGARNSALAELPCQSGYERDDATHHCRKVVAPVMLAPCGNGQYRNEATGRCRSIVAAAGTLVPCKDGQYRSEDTGRCRSLASAVAATLKPCPDDQFRNPLTNRCKAIASSEDATAADCGEGRERNPETHRCRNTVNATIPAATFAVAPVKEAAKGFVGWWAR